MYFPSEARCAIFDMDGTILNSMGLWEEIDILFLKKRGIPYTEDYGEAMKTKGFRDGARYSIERFHLHESPEEIMEEWTEMAKEAYRSRLQLKPGVKAYLEKLKKEGIRIALATVSPPQFYIPALTSGQIIDLFDDLSDASVVGGKKDGPDLYLHVAEKVGVPPRHCLVFEDTLHALRGAAQGNFLTCAVYDASSKAQWSEMCLTADFILTDFQTGPQRANDGAERQSAHNT